MKRVAIIIGYQGYGGIGPLSKAFRIYGYDKIVAVVDDASKFRDSGANEILECRRILDPQSLARTLLSVFTEETPCLCINDRAIFSYLSALEILLRSQTRCKKRMKWRFHVPSKGILRARVKAASRACWARCVKGSQPIDSTKFAVLRLNQRSSSICPEIHATLENKEHYVKPLSGYGSESVRKLLGMEAIRKWAGRARGILRQELGKSSGFEVEIDGQVYRPFEDVMVEEVLEGPEFTVDGVIMGGEVACVVQHKTELIHEPFEGNGIIICPPDYGKGFVPNEIEAHWLPGSPMLATCDGIKRFVTDGLRAIGLRNWVFHAEVVLTPGGLRFVEVNPRYAGGLLSVTAGFNLGLEVSEWCVRMHLGIKSRLPMPGIVVGEFPIYAYQTGCFEEMTGEDAVKFSNDVILRSVADPGSVISDLRQENYLAFVAVMGNSHSEVLERAANLQKIILPRFADEQPTKKRSKRSRRNTKVS